MSVTTLEEAPAEVEAPPSNEKLTPEAIDALVTRARDIISGRLVPPPLEPPPGSIEKLLKRFSHKVPPITPKALRKIADRWSLEATYQGKPVFVFVQPDGSYSVLAAGNEEIDALIAHMSDYELVKAHWMDTIGW